MNEPMASADNERLVSRASISEAARLFARELAAFTGLFAWLCTWWLGSAWLTQSFS